MERDRYPLHRNLGGTWGRSGRLRKFLPPSVIEPQTIQPLAGRYTYYTIPALDEFLINENYFNSS